MKVSVPLKALRLLLDKYKTPALYSVSSAIKVLSQTLGTLIIARYISPGDLGLWNTVYLAVTYSAFLQAGIINGLNLELPYTLGKGEEQSAYTMASVTQTYTAFISVIVFLLGLFYLLLGEVDNSKIKLSILSVMAIIMLGNYQSYLISTFRSKNSFWRLTKIQIVESCIIIISLILVIKYAYNGMVVRASIIIAFGAIMQHLARPIKVGFNWNKRVFSRLIILGFPIFGLAYLQSVAATCDRLLLVKYSGFTDVGLYSFAYFGLSVFSILSSSIAAYIYPRMSYDYGKTGNKELLWKRVKKITLFCLIILVPLSIFAYALIPFAISNYFPNYASSIPAMRILTFAGVFTGSIIGVNVLWSIRSWKYMVLYMVIYSVLLIICPYFGIRMSENKLIGGAYGVLVASFINALSGYTLSYFGTHHTPRK